MLVVDNFPPLRIHLNVPAYRHFNLPKTMDTMNGAQAEDTGDSRYQTDNSVSRKPQPKQQLSKAMEHMRFAVTVDPIPHTSTCTSPPLPESSNTTETSTISTEPPAENDAYGVPASFAPIRAPPSRSHDTQNNQKRSDPFAFGSRLLEEGDNIFEFNAWDHVTVDSTYQAFSEEQYERQRNEPVSEFDRKRYNDQPEKWWNQFYKNNKTNFFKNRKWLSQEFPILEELGKEGAPEAVLLEVGAGAGNSAFPILSKSENPRLKIHACDFSKKAVELIRSHELYDDGKRIQADVWDVAAAPDSENGGLPAGLKEGSVDVVLMIFIFSALSPKQWDQAVRNVWRVLKPGGQVLFRDYGRGDLAQVRFKKGRYMEDNFYVRGDGTRVYFFEQEELEEIWGGRKRDTQIGNLADTSLPEQHPDETETIESKIESLDLHDPEQKEQQQSNDDVNNPETPRPSFEVAHIGVDRRMLVNRQRRLKMYRCWMQAVFRKAGQESMVMTSTLRQDKEEEVQEGGEADVGAAEGGGVKV
jgi:tRNAThr (cytosine32-N3)-methyltransferase